MALILAALTGASLAADVTLNPGDDVATLTASLGAGDVVTFGDGTYELTGTLRWSGQGTESSPIVLEAAEGAEPVLQLAGGGWVAQLDDASHFTLRGLTFQGGPLWEEEGTGGLRLGGTLDTNITVAGCTFRHLGSVPLNVATNAQFIDIHSNLFQYTNEDAIVVGCSGVGCTVQDSTVRGNVIHSAGGASSWGVVVYHGSHSNDIVDNVIFQTSRGGIYAGSTEFEPPNRLEGNAIWDVVGAGILVEGASTVRNNLIMDVVGYGIDSNNSSRDTLEQVVIAHNTVVATSDWGIHLEDWPNRNSMVLANNAVANPTGLSVYFRIGDGEVDTTTWAAGNVLTGLVQGLQDDAYTAGAGYADFESIARMDLYPAGGSTLVDAADTDDDSHVPDVDFNGVPRQADLPDVGAYEWVGWGNPGWAVQPGFKAAWDAQVGESPDDEGGCASTSGDAALMLPFLVLVPLFRRRRET